MNIKFIGNYEQLEALGFKKGIKLRKEHPYDEIFDGCDYQNEWYHKMELFLDEDNNDEPKTDEQGIWFRTSCWVDTRNNYVYFEITNNDCSYHTEMGELDFMINTLLDLSEAGLIVREGKNNV